MGDFEGALVERCARELALTTDEVSAIAASAPKRYYVWPIEKRSGGTRTVCHPARELKPLQNYFLRNILQGLPVHSAATAYVPGSSIKKNASAHSSSRVIIKLDFSDFFNSIRAKDWRLYASSHFPAWSKDDIEFSCRILFWGGRSYTPKCLAIGAPTSPHISNVLLFEIDTLLNNYASRKGLVYTRYADDITFSSRNKIDYNPIIWAVKDALKNAHYSNLELNAAKTRLISSKFRRTITGIVVTPDHKISIGRERKRFISCLCHKFSVGQLSLSDGKNLAGLIAFARDVEPSFYAMLCRKYGSSTIDKIPRLLRRPSAIQLL